MIIILRTMRLMSFTSFMVNCTIQLVLIQGAGEEEEEEALIFDRYSRSLLQLPRRIPNNAICGAWAVACPAETLKEKVFIKKYSFTNTGLFVRKIHKRGSFAAEVNKNQCEDSFKLSLAYNVKELAFQFGFDIYYELTDAAYYRTYKFEDYKSPAEVLKTITTLKNEGRFTTPEFERVIRKAVHSDNNELWFNNDRKMGFAWIHFTTLVFSFSRNILKRMAYEIDSNSRWPVLEEQCTNFNLGAEFYRYINLDKLYEKNDENKFAQLKMPNSITCKSNFQCFNKWLLVPIDQFRIGLSSSPLCSNLVTIPVWKAKGRHMFYLRRIDQYLYALFRHLGEPLRIVAGVNGEHVYSNRRSRGKSTLYLDMDEKKIPIPKIIFKKVRYRIKDCQLEESYCSYYAIIVIHNDLSFEAKNRLCSAELTKQWGWEGITKDPDGKELDFIYVCPKTKEVLQKLVPGMLHRIEVTGPQLKLSEFPMSKDGKTIEKTNIVGDVNQKLEQFDNDGDNFELYAEKIMELNRRKYVEELYSQAEIKEMELEEESNELVMK